jgi:uncharacterized protein (DUF488 family)
MARWLPDLAGADYTRMPRLGGFRKGNPNSRNIALRHPSFRAYADYMETPEFLAALDELLVVAAKRRTAVMCSESVWWRCHRRLIADAATLLRRAEVQHLMHDGTLRPHALTEGVRVTSDGVLCYDVT